MLQVQSQRQEPLTTAHLAQTMSLLVLSNQELRERVLKELNENPALELLEDRVCPTCQRRLAHPGPCPMCSLQLSDEGPIVFTSPRDSYPTRYNGSKQTTYDELPELEPAAPQDLALHVLQQLAMEIEGVERGLAAYILASLDDEGFLQDGEALIARATRQPLSRVQRVLALIQRADPVGLATSGPRQALLVQLSTQEPSPITELAHGMLSDTFEWVGQRDFGRIAEHFEVSKREVHEALDYIQEHLNPYPRRGAWASLPQGNTQGDPNVYHQPDIQISNNPGQTGGALTVEIFAPVSGWLQISPAFRAALKGDDIPDEWKAQFERASLFVKCIHQRNNTMRQLMKVLVKTQRQFILEGDRHLIPMTRAEVADQIGVHESTVSRAVADKSVALPDRRIIPLARFFDRSLPARDCIKEIVSDEAKPLTDDQIADKLEDYGISIARRTVAKYRNMEGILPARLRQSASSNGNGRHAARV